MKSRICMHDISSLIKTSKRFALIHERLLAAIEEYLTTRQPELYITRLTQVCGPYEPFVKQEIRFKVDECINLLDTIPNIKRVMLTSFRLIIYYEEVE